MAGEGDAVLIFVGGAVGGGAVGLGEPVGGADEGGFGVDGVGALLVAGGDFALVDGGGAGVA